MVGRTKKKVMSDSEKEFIQGFACACASVARWHGMPSVALDVMKGGGFDRQKFEAAGVDVYDLTALFGTEVRSAKLECYIQRCRK